MSLQGAKKTPDTSVRFQFPAQFSRQKFHPKILFFFQKKCPQSFSTQGNEACTRFQNTAHAFAHFV
jgi:hypothetical protein